VAPAPPRAVTAPSNRGRSSDRDDKPVLGMGDHIPMFLQRPVRLKAKEDHE
jgi:hypothetical protein